MCIYSHLRRIIVLHNISNLVIVSYNLVIVILIVIKNYFNFIKWLLKIIFGMIDFDFDLPNNGKYEKTCMS